MCVRVRYAAKCVICIKITEFGSASLKLTDGKRHLFLILLLFFRLRIYERCYAQRKLLVIYVTNTCIACIKPCKSTYCRGSVHI